MAITVEGFRRQHKQFREEIEYDDESIEIALELAVLEMGDDPNYHGNDAKYTKLIYFLAAHHMVVFDRQERGDSNVLGSAISKTAGDVAVVYADRKTTTDTTVIGAVLSSTSYGQYFMMLKKRWRWTIAQTVVTHELA